MPFDVPAGVGPFDDGALGQRNRLVFGLDGVCLKKPQRGFFDPPNGNRFVLGYAQLMSTYPNIIGPYRVLQRLGHGGMGVVYHAERVDTGELAAVKTVRELNESLLSGFRRELLALSRIRHPGIVRVFDHGIHNGRPWYAMELLSGKTFRAFITDVMDVDRTRALSVIWRFCRALAFLHGEGIVHCDLKPENVLVLKNDQPVLFDFGLATFFSGSLNREALDLGEEGAGTVTYMSPEQIQGESIDARADLYGLGCMLYEVVVGAPPFSGKQSAEVAWAHLEREPVPPSMIVDDVPRDLEALILRLLAKRPADRLGYADDVLAALSQIDPQISESGAAPAARPYLYRPAFTGRERDLDQLRPLVDQLRRGKGSIAFIGGESGVGKTRLAVELGREARASGIRVVTGESTPVGTASGDLGAGTPLRAFKCVLDAVADRCREVGEAETEHLLGPRLKVLAAYEPSLLALPGAGAAPEPADLPPAAARLRLYAYLAAVISSFALEKPLLLVLDDMQWADELTLGFLEYLLHGAAFDRMKLCILATYRREEAPERLVRLIEERGVVSIALERLDESAVAAIVGDMLALSPPPRVLSRYLTRQSEGNPFFVAEYLRTAVEAGALFRDSSGTWELSEARGPQHSRHEFLQLPRTLRELVERRLLGLPPTTLFVAQVAAVLGRESTAELLGAVARIDDVELLQAIKELLRRQVIEESSTGRLRFVHDKIREYAYSSLEPADRARLHRRSAKALARSTKGDPSHVLATLGNHWERGGKFEKARQCYLQGARIARNRFAHDEAERLYRAFLNLVDGVTVDDIAARQELASDVLLFQGRAEDAVAELDAALACAQALGDVLGEAETLRRMGVALWELSRMDEAREFFDRAIDVVRTRGEANATFEGVTFGNLGNVSLQQGRLDEARDFYEQALAIHRTEGDVRNEGVKVGNIAIVHFNQGRFAEAESLYRHAIEIARETNDRRTEGRHLGNLALLLSECRRSDEAREAFESALAITREIGDIREEGIILGNLGEMYQMIGDLDRGLSLNIEAHQIHQRVGNRRFEAVTLIGRSHLERLFGRFARADACLSEAAHILNDVGDTLYLTMVVVGRGFLDLARGRDAHTHLEEATRLIEPLNASPESTIVMLRDELIRANDAFLEGRLLYHGQLVDDLPEGVQSWLRKRGEI